MTARRTNENAALPARRSRFGDPLPPAFYARDTEHVARELLGALLEVHSPEGVASGRIVETEAYVGEHDPACHAAAGRTNRTDPLYGPPGTAYVYFIYGVHWCVNAVTREAGLASAVLVRALEPVDGIELMRHRRPRARRVEDLTNGPGKLCAALGITGVHNRLGLQRPPILIRRGPDVDPDDVVETTRIGITKAADWPLRWYLRSSAFVSRR
ncbi:MAG TPA: DNA-3-methyladenine glycosylase [Gemmatimonadaceae bacterium]|nr:DNA-3-methyladenine glycosylase [Gemmatimonadaceae bacterium]